MSRVISVINWKGGVGKTTLTYHLGILLQSRSRDEKKYKDTEGFPKTLLIDLDPQCNLSIACLSEDKFEEKAFRARNKLKTVKDIFGLYLDNRLDTLDLEDFILKREIRAGKQSHYKYVDLLPSHPDLIYTDMQIAVYSKKDFKENLLGGEIYKFQIVKAFIEKLRDKYDYILIDCPPNLNYITQNALYESDFYLIPTILDKLSSYGILSIKNKVDDLNKLFASAAPGKFVKTKLAGIVANNVREYGEKPKASQYNVLTSLQKAFKTKVFNSYLTNGDGIPKALEQGIPVFALEGMNANATKQTKLLEEIADELLKRIK